jgi:MFS family permease
LFEVPSNLLLHKFGARIWIARILISWGIAAVLTGFVRSAPQLYVVRFLLGVAEAGFFPGILLYLTYWFPQRETAGGGSVPNGLFISSRTRSLPSQKAIAASNGGFRRNSARNFARNPGLRTTSVPAAPTFTAS